MLKKLRNFFFEEEEIVEDVYEEPVVEPTTEKVVTPVKEDKESARSTFINLDEKSVEMAVEVSREEPTKTRTIQADKPQTSKQPSSKTLKADDYEFSPVISPIFGISDKEKQRSVEVKKTDVKIGVTKGTKSVIGTVISPIYGIKDNEIMAKADSTVLEQHPENQMATIPDISIDDILDDETALEEDQVEINLFNQE